MLYHVIYILLKASTTFRELHTVLFRVTYNFLQGLVGDLENVKWMFIKGLEQMSFSVWEVRINTGDWQR